MKTPTPTTQGSYRDQRPRRDAASLLSIPIPEAEPPRPEAAVEDRFQYVLACARRVGFEGFDAMALQYYARNFDPASALAPEQRLSRNRRLPGLLAELRTQSASWSAWQSRNYQDEILKAAEEICAVECRESRRHEADGSDLEGLGEEELEEKVSIQIHIGNHWQSSENCDLTICPTRTETHGMLSG